MSQILAKAASEGDLSRAGIMKGMDDVGKLTFGGMVADEAYGAPEPASRSASRPCSRSRPTRWRRTEA